MSGGLEKQRMTARLVESLYVEAMVLADEARGYFDHVARADRDLLGASDRVTFSCESLKVTTRLMHVIAWLLHRKAEAAGEIAEGSGRLGHAAGTERSTRDDMPVTARALIDATCDLYDRVARLDNAPRAAESPARALMSRLEGAF
jgi:regulator of CtrA degradation